VNTARTRRRLGNWLPVKNRVFGRLWMISLVSGSLVAAQDIATRWVVHRSTSSAFLLSLVPTLSSAAFFLLTLPGGLLADRLPRNRLLSYIYAGLAVVSVALAFVCSWSRFAARGTLSLSLLFGAGLALSAPVWATLLVETVEKSDLEVAVALSGTQLNLSSIIGPAIGGLLLPRLGPEAVFLLGCLTFAAISIMTRFWWPIRKDVQRQTASLREALREIIQVLQQRPRIRTVIFQIVLFSFFIAVIPTLLPTLGLKVLKINSGELGLLFTSLGIGSIVGGVFLIPLIHAKLSANTVTVAACILLVMALYLIGVLQLKIIFFAVAALSGSAWTLAASEIWAAGQRATPDHSRGKINAVFMMVGSGAMALGGLAWASMADATGIRNTIRLAALTLLLSLPLRLRWSLDD
jgi:MFS family permease